MVYQSKRKLLAKYLASMATICSILHFSTVGVCCCCMGEIFRGRGVFCSVSCVGSCSSSNDLDCSQQIIDEYGYSHISENRLGLLQR